MPSSAPSAPFPILCQAGFFFFRPGQVVEHPCVQSRGLLFCERGCGEVEINGRSFAITAGTLLLEPWGRHVRHRADRKSPMGIVMNHVVPRHAAGEPVTFAIAHEPEHALHHHPERADGEWGWNPGETARSFHIENHAPLALLMTYGARWYQRRHWDVQEARWLAALLEREIQHLTEKATSLIPDAPPALIAMINFIDQNLPRPIRIAELAELVGRSDSYVEKLFRRHVGASPKQYLQDKRVARARDLLHASSLNVFEVAQAVGFTSPYHFSRCFRRMVGESPREYRRKFLRL